MKRKGMVALVLVFMSLGVALPVQGQGWVRTDVFVFGDPSTVVGKAWLSRRANSVTMILESDGSTPDWTYTVWWVVFNKPEHCVGGCGADDFARPEVMATVLYADGVVPGANGKIHAAGRRTLGYNGVILFGPGVAEPLTAEVHLVVRCHGPQIPGVTGSQITTFNGGCPPAPGFPISVNGIPGGNSCVDIQAAVFPLP